MEITHHLKFQNLHMSSLGVNKEGVNLNTILEITVRNLKRF